jgi:hypothetical protein
MSFMVINSSNLINHDGLSNQLIQESKNLLCYGFLIKRCDSFLYKKKKGSTYENINWIKRNV